jgi:hypothetical protein
LTYGRRRREKRRKAYPARSVPLQSELAADLFWGMIQVYFSCGEMVLAEERKEVGEVMTFFS